jgi:uncharacterized protein (TIGR00369 family)
LALFHLFYLGEICASVALKEAISVQKLPNFHGCFVCGDRNPSGLGVRFRTDGERVVTTFTPQIPQMGFHGRAHGGVMASLLDETMGWAPALLNRRFCLTVELTVQYLKPLPLGTEVTVSGWVTSGSRRLWEAEGEISDADGTIYARGKGRYISMNDQQTQDVVDYLTFDEGCVPPGRISRLAAEE